MIGLAALAGLVLGAVGLIGMDFVASSLLVAKYGSREGSAAMAGFFFFGPFGALSGLLLGVGLVLRFGGVSLTWGSRLMIGAACIFGIGAAVLAVTAMPKPSAPSAAQVLQIELDVSEADWGPGQFKGKVGWAYLQGDSPDRADWSMWSRSFENGRYIGESSVGLVGERRNPRIVVQVGGRMVRFPLSLPEEIRAPIAWTEWRADGDVWFRYQVVLKR
jgi:MFS family permease